MAYQYDVFLSYRHGLAQEWVNSHFLNLFRWHLEGALGRQPEIFIDREGISAGDTWPLRIHHALCHSRCLVAIWSPSYFNSEWCMRECISMLRREQTYGYRTPENPSGLVLPVNISDGQAFPDFARSIDYFDARDYMLVGPAFTRSEVYVEFQQRIREWSVEVADAIRRAPHWSNDWLDQEIVEVPDPPTVTVPPPTLR